MFTPKISLIDLWSFHTKIPFPLFLHILILTVFQPLLLSRIHICQKSLTNHWMIKLQKFLKLLPHNSIHLVIPFLMAQAAASFSKKQYRHNTKTISQSVSYAEVTASSKVWTVNFIFFEKNKIQSNWTWEHFHSSFNLFAKHKSGKCKLFPGQKQYNVIIFDPTFWSHPIINYQIYFLPTNTLHLYNFFITIIKNMIKLNILKSIIKHNLINNITNYHKLSSPSILNIFN